MKSYNVIRAVDKWCAKIIGWIMAALLFSQLLILFAGVIARYVFNSPFTWSDELASLLLVAVTFMGGYSALVSGKLANVSMLVNKLPVPAQKILVTVRNIAIIAVCIIITRSLLDMMSKPVILKQVTATLRIPMKYVYLPMPVSFILMAVHSFVQLIGVWLEGPDKKEVAEE